MVHALLRFAWEHIGAVVIAVLLAGLGFGIDGLMMAAFAVFCFIVGLNLPVLRRTARAAGEEVMELGDPVRRSNFVIGVVKAFLTLAVNVSVLLKEYEIVTFEDETKSPTR